MTTSTAAKQHIIGTACSRQVSHLVIDDLIQLCNVHGLQADNTQVMWIYNACAGQIQTELLRSRRLSAKVLQNAMVQLVPLAYGGIDHMY